MATVGSRSDREEWVKVIKMVGISNTSDLNLWILIIPPCKYFFKVFVFSVFIILFCIMTSHWFKYTEITALHTLFYLEGQHKMVQRLLKKVKLTKINWTFINNFIYLFICPQNLTKPIQVFSTSLLCILNAGALHVSVSSLNTAASVLVGSTDCSNKSQGHMQIMLK